jgi:hypothetical protein
MLCLNLSKCVVASLEVSHFSNKGYFSRAKSSYNHFDQPKSGSWEKK